MNKVHRGSWGAQQTASCVWNQGWEGQSFAVGAQGGKDRQDRKVFKDIVLENLPNFMKIRNLQIQEEKENP